MEELEMLMNNINISDFDISGFNIDTNHSVIVTEIINPHHFYVRSNKHKAFIEMVESIEPTPRTRPINYHDIVIYNMGYNSHEAKYARGLICYTDEAKNCYDIFAVDYGYSHKLVPREHIWECNFRLAKIPNLAYPSQLANCVALNGEIWSRQSIAAFVCFVKNRCVFMHILDKSFNKLVVELMMSFQDVGHLMVVTGCAATGYSHNDISRRCLQ